MRSLRAIMPKDRFAMQKGPVISPLGVDGLRISFADSLSEPANRAALAFRAALDQAGLTAITETSTALTSAYLRFDLAGSNHAQMQKALQDLLDSRDWYAAPLPHGRRLWRVPAVFGGDLAPQLPGAAELAGLTPDAAANALCAAPLRVQAIGFAPGQPYLGELPDNWDIPRQSGLTPQVPAGALTVAIRQMVLFSVSTPTGWRHIGQTALRLFRPEEAEPFLLRPGDEVLFCQINRDTYENLRQNDPDGGATSERIAP
jgi:inhibitor of KinA